MAAKNTTPGDSNGGQVIGPAQVSLQHARERAHSWLSTVEQPLFGVLDAARSPRIYMLMRETKAPFQCLYQGQAAETMREFAPYLVRLESGGEILRQVAIEGWGDAWGIFLQSRAPIASLREHLRHFVMVEMPDQTHAYFRFYDPRVLRSILPTFDRAQRDQFFGPIAHFIVERSPTELWIATNGPELRSESIHLADVH